MIFLYILLSLLLLLIVLYLFAIMPSLQTQLTKKFKYVQFAHRGLHGNGVPENSMQAFSLAVEQGLGIEFDIHLTKDNQVVIIHDNDTQRVCGKKLLVEESTYEELCTLSLENTDEKIPLLTDLLKLVNGKVPLLVELKSNAMETKLCPFAAEILGKYTGEYCIESFNTFIVAWYRKHRKHIVRGQLSTKTKTIGGDCFKDKLFGFVLTNLLGNFIAKPNFIAYDYNYISNLSVQICKYLFRTPIFVWTLKGEKEQKAAQGKFFGYIFEQ
ncbi:MAG: glycerophosphodiester phosphodiesterase family protein [Oscillospiraceae bacterium]